MKVATWRGGSRFTLDEAPEPVAGPGQVVVDVAAAGICGTDVHATQGLFPWTPPMVLGHEYSGVVREVGRGVSRRLIGRAVACEPSFGCGTCLHCRNGRISQCDKATRVGGLAERAAPRRRAIAMVRSPMMPPPITTTVALRGILNISSPERQQDAGSASAAVTGSSPFGSGCTQASGRAARSAKPPTRVALAHWLMRPFLQCRHVPHPKLGSHATACPRSRRLTPRPTSRTTPEYSWPMIMGGVHGKRPWVACTSVPQMPAAATSTTT